MGWYIQQRGNFLLLPNHPGRKRGASLPQVCILFFFSPSSISISSFGPIFTIPPLTMTPISFHAPPIAIQSPPSSPTLPSLPTLPLPFQWHKPTSSISAPLITPPTSVISIPSSPPPSPPPSILGLFYPHIHQQRWPWPQSSQPHYISLANGGFFYVKAMCYLSIHHNMQKGVDGWNYVVIQADEVESGDMNAEMIAKDPST